MRKDELPALLTLANPVNQDPPIGLPQSGVKVAWYLEKPKAILEQDYGGANGPN